VIDQKLKNLPRVGYVMVILRTSVFFCGKISSFFDKEMEDFLEFFLPSVILTFMLKSTW
jgi:hypothetical protein